MAFTLVSVVAWASGQSYWDRCVSSAAVIEGAGVDEPSGSGAYVSDESSERTSSDLLSVVVIDSDGLKTVIVD